MPRMDGIEATQRIRADSRFSALPIIAMTAHTLVEERERCRNAGMNDFISKPIDPDGLYAMVARWAAAGNAPLPVWPTIQPVAAVGMPVLSGIDTAIGLKRMMNKPAFYEKVLRDFYVRFRHATGEISQAIANDQHEEAERQAHSAKGLAATIGAMELNQAAMVLEQALKNRENPEPALSDFSRELDLVRTSLQQAYALP